MAYLPGLAVALAALWFALSGETAPMFLGLGMLSVVLTLWLCGWLNVVDRDASPYHRSVQLLIYLAALLIDIVKANLAVIARILGPRHSIDPAVVKVKTEARTDLGRALFANSITLTPGTVTMAVEGVDLTVHALVREHARSDSFVPMDRRAARAGDGKA